MTKKSRIIGIADKRSANKQKTQRFGFTYT